MRSMLMLLSVLLLTSCSLAPTYQRPTLPQAIKYKESGPWLQAKPHQSELERGPWWKMYHDTTLNQLEDQVIPANQDIKAALARYEQARAAVAIAKADYFPTISGVGNATRQQASKNVANVAPTLLFNDFVLGINLNYELDVWGRVRNSVAAAKNLERGSAADVALINLSLHAELATDYFNLRSADSAQHVLEETVKAYQKALYLTRKRYEGGAVSVVDVDQAQTLLESAKTQAADVHIRRAQFEHAMAVLIGQSPALFSLKPSLNKMKLVTIAPDLPSTLLERRPDIAEAEYAVQAANDNIGVARTAFFPAFNLATAIGYDSAILPQLLSSPSLAWSVGPTLSSALLNNGSMPEITQTIFDGGKIVAISKQAWGQYHETVAKYQQTVLTAYKEVEDSLIALRQLDREHHTQANATAAANRALKQAMFRYTGGLTTYLEVVVAENTALQNELSLVDVTMRRQATSVQLIKSLGGGWQR